MGASGRTHVPTAAHPQAPQKPRRHLALGSVARRPAVAHITNTARASDRPARQSPRPRQSWQTPARSASTVPQCTRLIGCFRPRAYSLQEEELIGQPDRRVLKALDSNRTQGTQIRVRSTPTGRIITTRVESGRATSGRPVGQQHGCKSALLFAPLPAATPQEA